MMVLGYKEGLTLLLHVGLGVSGGVWSRWCIGFEEEKDVYSAKNLVSEYKEKDPGDRP